MEKLSDTERGWIAGFFEGEANFSTGGSGEWGKGKKYHPFIGVSQRELEPLVRLQDDLGGAIYRGKSYETQRNGTRQMHMWRLMGYAKVKPVADWLRPLLGKWRVAQLDRILETWERRPITYTTDEDGHRRFKSHCPQGHAYDVYRGPDSRRHQICKVCQKASVRKYLDRKKAERIASGTYRKPGRPRVEGRMNDLQPRPGGRDDSGD